MKKVILCLLLVGCCSDKKDQTPQAYDVTFLFEKDGCRMYRFVDFGYKYYFSSCTGITQGTHLHGKTRKHFSVETLP